LVNIVQVVDQTIVYSDLGGSILHMPIS